MKHRNFFRDATITAIMFMVLLLVINNDYSEDAFLKVAWQGFLFVPFYYILSRLIAKNKAKKNE